MAEPASSTVFTEPTETQTTETQEVKTGLEDWVGEGKKFTTVEQLVASYSHAQNHIQSLERTQSELKEDLVKRKTIEELYDELKKPKTTQAPLGEPDGSSSLSQADIEALANESAKGVTASELASFKQELKEDSNEVFAEKELVAKFGTNAALAVQKKAKELGRTVGDLQAMSRQDPKLFIALFHQEASAHDSTMTSNISADHLASASTKTPARNNKYYSDMRKTDPKLYYAGSTQMQMQRDAAEFGSDFYK